MKQMQLIVFTSKSPCYIDFGGAFYLISPEEPLAVPYNKIDPSGLVFTVWGSGNVPEGKLAVPALHRIAFEEGRAAGDTIRTVDWGDITEAEVEPLFIPLEQREEPRLIDSLEIPYSGGGAKAELYTDNGLRLLITPREGEQFSIALGEGSGGRLFRYDIGPERLTAVRMKSENRERLILLNGMLEKVLDVSGTQALIEDGAPAVYEELGTIRGHRRKTNYELSGGAFKKKRELTGFFGREPNEPAGASAKALALVQELRLGIEGWNAPLIGGPLEDASREELQGFLGEYDSELAYPAEEPEGRATVGLVKGGGVRLYPKKILFEFVNGVITDIKEP